MKYDFLDGRLPASEDDKERVLRLSQINNRGAGEKYRLIPMSKIFGYLASPTSEISIFPYCGVPPYP